MKWRIAFVELHSGARDYPELRDFLKRNRAEAKKRSAQFRHFTQLQLVYYCRPKFIAVYQIYTA